MPVFAFTSPTALGAVFTNLFSKVPEIPPTGRPLTTGAYLPSSRILTKSSATCLAVTRFFRESPLASFTTTFVVSKSKEVRSSLNVASTPDSVSPCPAAEDARRAILSDRTLSLQMSANVSISSSVGDVESITKVDESSTASSALTGFITAVTPFFRKRVFIVATSPAKSRE